MDAHAWTIQSDYAGIAGGQFDCFLDAFRHVRDFFPAAQVSVLNRYNVFPCSSPDGALLATIQYAPNPR
jgi:hypothetical protein